MSKAGRPKNGSEELPDWFDIEKYRGARDMGAMGWHDQLFFRSKLLIALDNCLKAGDTEFKRLQPALKMLHDDPIITEERVAESRKEVIESETQEVNSEGEEYTLLTGHLEFDPIIGMTVRPLRGAGVTVLTMIHRDNIKPDSTDEIEGKIVAHEDGTYDFENPPLTWCERPIVAIDPSIKDEIIIREVRELLREIRKTQKAHPSAFTKDSDFMKWYNSGVLPYLDLLTWESMGHEFKGAAFVNELSQILDQPISSEGAAIKSAQTYLKNLLTPQTLRILAAQATSERQQGRKSGKFLVR